MEEWPMGLEGWRGSDALLVVKADLTVQAACGVKIVPVVCKMLDAQSVPNLEEVAF